jgi:hypothetical protein
MKLSAKITEEHDEDLSSLVLNVIYFTLKKSSWTLILGKICDMLVARWVNASWKNPRQPKKIQDNPEKAEQMASLLKPLKSTYSKKLTNPRQHLHDSLLPYS